MAKRKDGMARRTVLMSAGAGIGAGLMAGISPADAAKKNGKQANAAGEIWSSEYWAMKGNVKLSLWRKRIGAPKRNGAPLPVLFLVHGSSNSARSSYDLNVPKAEYSLMNVMA